MSVRIYKSESYQPSVGMVDVDIEVFESYDEGCKRYQELLAVAKKNPSTSKWKFLCIDVRTFGTIRSKAHVTSDSGSGFHCIGSFTIVNPADPTYSKY